MSNLYLFPVCRDSLELARRYASEICDKIRERYPDCRYLEKVSCVSNGEKVFDKRQITQEERLISFVASCLG